MYYEAKIRYEKMTEDGSVRRVNEQFICEALVIEEVSSIIAERLAPFISGEYTITSIAETKIAELIDGDSEEWWTVRFNIITPDERTGKEKRTPSLVLVPATSSQQAETLFNESMRGSISDYEIRAITATKIQDVYTAK